MEVFLILPHDSARKYVCIRNCLTRASTSYKNYFQYAGVSLTLPITENS